MDAARARKLADRIAQIVAEMLERRIKDPRLGFITVTDARLTGDLRDATVYYTVYGPPEEQAATAVALESAKGVIRSEVGRQTGSAAYPVADLRRRHGAGQRAAHRGVARAGPRRRRRRGAQPRGRTAGRRPRPVQDGRRRRCAGRGCRRQRDRPAAAVVRAGKAPGTTFVNPRTDQITKRDTPHRERRQLFGRRAGSAAGPSGRCAGERVGAGRGCPGNRGRGLPCLPCAPGRRCARLHARRRARVARRRRSGTRAAGGVSGSWHRSATIRCRVPDNLRFLPGLDLLTQPREFPAEPQVMITFDAASRGRLGVLAPNAARAGELIVVDHHASNTRFGTIHLVDPAAAATAVLACELVDRLGLPLTRPIAVGLYAGLVTDTGSFKHASTTVGVHGLAARLLGTGIEPEVVARELWDRAPFGYLRVLSAALGRAVLEPRQAGGLGLVWTTVSRADRAAHGLGYDTVEPMIDVVRRTEEAEVAIVFKQDDDGAWQVSARSKGQGGRRAGVRRTRRRRPPGGGRIHLALAGGPMPSSGCVNCSPMAARRRKAAGDRRCLGSLDRRQATRMDLARRGGQDPPSGRHPPGGPRRHA